MKHNLETFWEQFEKMPIYGELRELDKRLTFGNYLTVLKEWWDKTKKQKEGFENDLRLFIAIHENEGHKISPKLLRKEVLAE